MARSFVFSGSGSFTVPKLIEILGEHGEFDALWLDK